MVNGPVRLRLSVFGACAALSAACGGEGSPTGGVPESVASELPPGAVDLAARVSAEPVIAEDGNIELVTMPATPEPACLRAPPRGGCPVAEGLGRWRQVSAPLHVTVATDGSGRTEIRIPGTDDSVRVSRVAPDGATSGAVEASLEGSLVRLREVVPHVDSLLFGVDRGLEELWVLHRPEGRVEYELELPPGYALSQSRAAVEIVDARGRAKLRVLADKAWDAAGQELAALPVVEGSRLRVEVEGDGTWPITVDPEWQAGEQGLQFARKLHAATLLADGRVLITGGISGGLATDAAEIYDPIGGHFVAIDAMTAPRAGHTATLLRDATVLIAGGNAPGEPATGELFNPVTRTFEERGRLQQRDRAGHTASLLYPDALAGTDMNHPGIVLLAGGCKPEAGRQAWRGCEAPLRDAEVYDGNERRFISVGSMAYPYGRAQHTATLKSATLTSPSMVILAGGTGVTQAESEVFLPAPPPEYGRFEPVGAVGVGRSSHTATLLHDYKILLVGNAVTQDNAESASVWDPDAPAGAGAVASLPALHDVRSWHSATLLPTGRVVLAGGISSTLSASAQDYPPLETVEHFDPDQGGFLEDQPLAEARAFHTSTLLPNSAVLVTGGSRRGGGEHLSAEIFVAEDGSFSELGNVSAFGSHTATLLPPEPAVNAEGILEPPRRVLIVGGGVATQPTELRELDIVSGTAAVVGTLSSSRPGHTATLLRDGSVLIVGGGRSGPSAELYRSASRELVTVGAPAHARSYHTATLLPDGSVLIAGGTADTAPVEIFEPGDPAFRSSDEVRLPPVTGHTSTLLPDGRVLIAGGTVAGTPRNALFIYDPQSDHVTEATLSDPRAGHTATVLPAGGVLIAGGRASEPLSSAELLHFDSGRATVEVLDLRAPREQHTATLLVDGRVLLIGGGPGSELYDPMANRFLTGPRLNTDRIAHTATLLPNAGVLVLGGGGDAPPEVWRDDTLHPDERRAQIRDIADAARAPGPIVSLVAGESAPFSGHSFTCMSEASGGRLSTSSTNHPVAYWMPLGGGYASLGGVTQWSSTQGSYAPPLTPYPGPGLLFFITNGIRSAGRMVTVEPALLGNACNSGSECASGFCSTGVCCNAACDDACHMCSDEGECLPKEEGAVCSADDGQPAHCFSGECEPGCTSNFDCPDGVCGVDGLCRNPITPPENSGCAVPARSRGSDGTFIAGLLLLAALGRRGSSRILRKNFSSSAEFACGEKGPSARRESKYTD